MITKNEIDNLAAKFETVEFIKDDPVRFPNRFKNKKDIEIAGFLSSLVAYGRRDVFTKNSTRCLILPKTNRLILY